MKPILVDTGFLVSLYDRRERAHEVCVKLHEQLPNPLVTCEAVLTETFFLLHKLPEAQRDILASVDQDLLEVRFRLATCAASVLEIMSKYRDTPVSFADACLVEMADELDTGDILTLDSDFSHYRWRKNKRFNLLIPLG